MAIENKLTALAKQLSRGSSGNLGVGKSLLPTSLLVAGSLPSERPAKVPNTGGQKARSAISVTKEVADISFGSPSKSKLATKQGGSQWENLLTQTASGGISNALGGGLLNVVGGIGGLISSITGLFGGGKKTEAPLIRFRLPASENETAYLDPKSTSVYHGSAVESSNRVTGSSAAVSPNGITGPMYRNQSQLIAQAVKQALLNSSSLNDVIAEI